MKLKKQPIAAIPMVAAVRAIAKSAFELPEPVARNK